jgi:hypothetical protein
MACLFRQANDYKMGRAAVTATQSFLQRRGAYSIDPAARVASADAAFKRAHRTAYEAFGRTIISASESCGSAIEYPKPWPLARRL